MKKICIEKWDRKSHYEWFSKFADPTMAIDVKMDITNILAFCKINNISSFAVIMYIACNCINKIDNLRIRVQEGNVVDVENANASYTVMTKSGTFINCRVETDKGFKYFIDRVNNDKKYWGSHDIIQKSFNTTSIINDIYFSCLPWVNFSSVRQPIPDMSDENKSIPRVCWGKYDKKGKKTYMMMNITANHALADGEDISKCIIDIQNAFNDKNYLNSLMLSSEDEK